MCSLRMVFHHLALESVLKVQFFTFIGGRRNTDRALDVVGVASQCRESGRLRELHITKLDGLNDHDKGRRKTGSTT